MHSVKTTTYNQNNNVQWYLHIFNALTLQSVSQSLSMKWNHHFRSLTMFVFNFGVGSLEQSVKLGWFVIFDFLGNSPLKTPLFPNWQPKSSAFYSVFIVWAVFQLRWWKKTYLKCWPLFCSQIFKFSNFVATSKARIWLAICEFLWLLTNQNVWFVSFFALN